jgi:regulator of replication initiation timing
MSCVSTWNLDVRTRKIDNKIAKLERDIQQAQTDVQELKKKLNDQVQVLNRLHVENYVMKHQINHGVVSLPNEIIDNITNYM